MAGAAVLLAARGAADYHPAGVVLYRPLTGLPAPGRDDPARRWYARLRIATVLVLVLAGLGALSRIGVQAVGFPGLPGGGGGPTLPTAPVLPALPGPSSLDLGPGGWLGLAVAAIVVGAAVGFLLAVDRATR